MIRSLTHQDCAAASAIIRAAFDAIEVPLDPPPSASKVTVEAIVAHLDAGGSGAMADDEGCVLWSPKAAGLYISRLAVRPDAQGRGVAWALLTAAEEAARAAGLSSLRLEVRLALTGNRRLFRRAGFVEGMQHAHPGYAKPTYVSAEKLL